MRLHAHAIAMVVLFTIVGVSFAEETENAFADDDQGVIYTIGFGLASQFRTVDLNAAELEVLFAGLRDGINGTDPKVDVVVMSQKIQGFATERQARFVEKEKARGVDFANKAAGEEGAERTPSGMIYKEISPGTGTSPQATDEVIVHYQGTLTDGTVFDSSREATPPDPVTFPLNGVITCFSEGIQRMKVGGTSKLVCPSSVAYGDQGRPPSILPGATLQFEVELVGVVGTEPATSTPEPEPVP